MTYLQKNTFPHVPYMRLTALIITAASLVGFPLLWAAPIVDLSRPTPARAAAAWQPSGGAAPAQPVQAGTTPAITLRCRFASSNAKRASWDVPVSLDLRLVRGIRFLFNCPDLSAVGSLFIYVRSGQGWHAMPFEPRGTGEWETIELLKVRSRVEGRPSGWGQIDTLRLSAWRGSPGNTAFTIANFTAIHPTTTSAVIRAISARPHLSEGDARGVYTYAENIALGLDSQGLNPAILDDTDITPNLLRALKLVFLPYAPRLAPTATAEIARFARQGGHVIAFYDLPGPIQQSLGIRLGAYHQGTSFEEGIHGFLPRRDRLPGAPPRVAQASWNLMSLAGQSPAVKVGATWENGLGQDTAVPALVLSSNGAWMSHVYLGQDPVGGPRFLAALTARALPGAWATVANSRLQDLAKGLPHTSFADACSELTPKATPNPRAAALLGQSVRSYNKAVATIKAGNALAALPLLDEARRKLSVVVCALEPSPQREFRGIWCHRGHGITGNTWEQSVAQLRCCGFNALLVNMASAGRADFHTPRLLPNKDGIDHLANCAAACRRHGIQLHVWFVCLRIESADRDALRKRGIILGEPQTTSAGKRLTQWLCPSDPRNRQHLIKTTADVAQRYPIDGIHLDYIRYSGQQTCFCTGCRQRFETSIGHRVKDWPTSCTKPSRTRTQWLNFRRNTITSLLEEVRTKLRKTKPHVSLSAAVYPREATARDSVAQEWSEWGRHGLVDFLCPMSYADSPEGLHRMIERGLPRRGKTATPVYPGIGVSSRKLDPIATVRQIRTTRSLGTGGFILFEYNRQTATEILPLLAQGATAPR